MQTLIQPLYFFEINKITVFKKIKSYTTETVAFNTRFRNIFYNEFANIRLKIIKVYTICKSRVNIAKLLSFAHIRYNQGIYKYV